MPNPNVLERLVKVPEETVVMPVNNGIEDADRSVVAELLSQVLRDDVLPDVLLHRDVHVDQRHLNLRQQKFDLRVRSVQDAGPLLVAQGVLAEDDAVRDPVVDSHGQPLEVLVGGQQELVRLGLENELAVRFDGSTSKRFDRTYFRSVSVEAGFRVPYPGVVLVLVSEYRAVQGRVSRQLEENEKRFVSTICDSTGAGAD